MNDEMSNTKWWHRNTSKTGFCINGYINAYPDIIAMTNSGRILVIEPNHDIKQKSLEKQGGEKYCYFMVFESINPEVKGMISFDEFLKIASKL